VFPALKIPTDDSLTLNVVPVVTHTSVPTGFPFRVNTTAMLVLFTSYIDTPAAAESVAVD
jgi:hypothetical protein